MKNSADLNQRLIKLDIINVIQSFDRQTKKYRTRNAQAQGDKKRRQ